MLVKDVKAMSKVNFIKDIYKGATGCIARQFSTREFVDNKGTGKVIKWFGDNISSPENRLILGATAMVSQTYIDFNNKEVDKKTRNVSCARTIAKIVAGTLTGVSIRAGYIHLTKRFSAVGQIGAKTLINVGKIGTGNVKEIVITKARKFFTPEGGVLRDGTKLEILSDKTHAYKEYQKAMGTTLAIVTMVFTNFLIDAPLTKFLTNRINKKFDAVDSDAGKKPSGGIKA